MYLYLLINILLYFVYWNKQRKKNGQKHFSVLILVYLFVSVFALLFYINTKEFGGYEFVKGDIQLTLWPFIYIFVCFYFLSRIYDHSEIKIFKENESLLRIITWLYIVSVIFYISLFFPKLISNLSSGAWAEVYNDSQTHEEYYRNQFEHLFMVFCMYFRIPATIILFYNLTKPKIPILETSLLAISLISYIFCCSIVAASRALMFMGILGFVVVFFFFKPYISNNVSRRLTIWSSSVIGAVFLLMAAITVARYSQYGEDVVYSSIVFYFGHPMIVFDYGVVDTIKQFAHGAMFLGDSTIGDSELGTHCDPMFSTIVGSLYKDFGPYLTILISFLFPLLLSMIFNLKKRVYDLAEISMYFYFFNDILMGAFYLNSSILNWLMFTFIFIILKCMKMFFKGVKVN